MPLDERRFPELIKELYTVVAGLECSHRRIERVLADSVFRKNVGDMVQIRRQVLEAHAWFQLNHSQDPMTCVAYFSMELWNLC